MIPLTEGETRIVLEEGVGPVPVTIRVENGVPRSAQLTTARAPEFRSEVPRDHELAELLSLSDADISGGPLRSEAVSCGVPFLLAPLASRDAVSRARLNTSVWERVLAHGWTSEIFLFDASAVGTGGPIRARMFAPALGVGEDPATGSAGAALAAYLARQAGPQASLDWIVEQGYEMGRPSILSLSAEKNGEAITAVRVAGQCVLASQGTLQVR